jgi:ATP-dependent RNA helicase DDX24/MAK5
MMGQKRARDPKAQVAEANKRKKAAKSDAASSDDYGSLGVDDLNWKEVAMPDRMDDAEGFFGLEEIEGVDIIKQGDGGVQFKVRGSLFDNDVDKPLIYMVGWVGQSWQADKIDHKTPV